MEASGPQTPFEVFCERCRVTFPVGTRRCIHCGEPIGRDRFRPSLELPPGTSDIDLEELPQERSRFLSPMTMVWIALLVGGYLARACSG